MREYWIFSSELQRQWGNKYQVSCIKKKLSKALYILRMVQYPRKVLTASAEMRSDKKFSSEYGEILYGS